MKKSKTNMNIEIMIGIQMINREKNNFSPI